MDGPSDLSLLRDRRCFDSRESGVICPSALVMPSVLNLSPPRYYPDSPRSGLIWLSVPAECLVYRVPHSSGYSLMRTRLICPSGVLRGGEACGSCKKERNELADDRDL